jgi:hypothetical protein
VRSEKEELEREANEKARLNQVLAGDLVRDA